MEPEAQLRLEREIREKLDAGDERHALQPFYPEADPFGAALMRETAWLLEDLFQPVEARSALHRAVVLIEKGIAPPPELLWTIQACYREYLEAGGATSLEEALQGRPQKKVGTVAQQFARGKRTLNHDFRYKIEFDIAKSDGAKDSEAAVRAHSETVRVIGWATDPESWLRQHRRAVRKRYRPPFHLHTRKADK